MSSFTPLCTYEKQPIAVIGYGVTGKACANFLLHKGAHVTVFDASFTNTTLPTRDEQQNLTFRLLEPSVDLSDFAQVVVSPGVNLQQAYIQNYINNKGDVTRVIGDIELFARELNKQNSQQESLAKKTRVVAITGSNGKSTVVDMLTQACISQGINAVLGGNFGTSALTLLDNNKLPSSQHIDVIILELSSFQLESTYSLQADVACILNVSDDHLDRHGNLENYIQAKQQIYVNARSVIFNRDDSTTFPPSLNNAISFGLHNEHDLSNDTGGMLMPENFYQTQQGIYCGKQLLLNLHDFLPVSHVQVLNMQVVLACCKTLNMSIDLAVLSLRDYKGLPHRFQRVSQSATTMWINDSKATNPGACVAAIESLAQQVDFIVLIAGGDAKGANMGTLAPVIKKHVNHLVLIGKDAALFTHFSTPFTHASSMQHAVEIAASLAHDFANEHGSGYVLEKDAIQQIAALTACQNTQANFPFIGVMLSPACASLDMFSHYQQRGEHFTLAVNNLAEVA